MARYGQTANGMAHFAPMMRLEAPQLDIGNPFKDYIAQAIAERELELKEKGLGLDEQKLAYLAANHEADRDLARELAGQKTKDAKDILKLEYSYKNNLANKTKAEEDLIQKEINKYYGALTEFHDLVGDLENPQQFLKAFREHQKWLGNNEIVDFITNQGAKAAELNNLFMQNNINKAVVGDIIKEQSENGSENVPRNFRGKSK